MGENLSELQRNIGYQFCSEDILRKALTHKSFSKDNNETLEFIGDAVLGYLIAVELFHRDSALGEDALSLMRASLVRGTALAEIAREIDLAPYLLLGSGERKSGGRQRDSILANAFEALIGAIHEDGGIQACAATVEHIFSARLASIDLENLKDAKTKLQELLQGAHMNLPDYSVAEVGGVDHQRRYTVVCMVCELDLECRATASSRRGAEQSAAAEMLEMLAVHDLD
jgi:ribonuclease-3